MTTGTEAVLRSDRDVGAKKNTVLVTVQAKEPPLTHTMPGDSSVDKATPAGISLVDCIRTPIRPGTSSRRAFLQAAAGAGLALLGGARLLRAAPANDPVRVGIIGLGSAGARHLKALMRLERVAVTAICDVWQQRIDTGLLVCEQNGAAPPGTHRDYRDLLARDDLQAVFIATPDHWHALMAINACQAGKDVYLEMPLSTTVVEAGAVADAVKRYGRVLQCGIVERSLKVFQQATALLHQGKLGRISTATAWTGTNETASVESLQDPPGDLDWDLWLGPAPSALYSPQRHFGWRAWRDYRSGGQLAEDGVRLFDVIHWGIGQRAPLSVAAMGSGGLSSSSGHDFETVEGLAAYSGCAVTWEQRYLNTYASKSSGVRFQCVRGQLVVDRNSYVVEPQVLGIPEYLGEPQAEEGSKTHYLDFLRCIRSRELPAASIDVGLDATIAALLVDISAVTRRKLQWDAESSRFLWDEQANRYLYRAYRAPWTL